ncbi:hypothetical protein F5884DRAFT_850596 [Xylogone sp. PMI_703]|nr:hypothetical protein F5884DRAFT_850596 [Xylogone sp. PMI_703]
MGRRISSHSDNENWSDSESVKAAIRPPSQIRRSLTSRTSRRDSYSGRYPTGNSVGDGRAQLERRFLSHTPEHLADIRRDSSPPAPAPIIIESRFPSHDDDLHSRRIRTVRYVSSFPRERRSPGISHNADIPRIRDIERDLDDTIEDCYRDRESPRIHEERQRARREKEARREREARILEEEEEESESERDEKLFRARRRRASVDHDPLIEPERVELGKQQTINIHFKHPPEPAVPTEDERKKEIQSYLDRQLAQFREELDKRVGRESDTRDRDLQLELARARLGYDGVMANAFGSLLGQLSMGQRFGPTWRDGYSHTDQVVEELGRRKLAELINKSGGHQDTGVFRREPLFGVLNNTTSAGMVDYPERHSVLESEVRNLQGVVRGVLETVTRLNENNKAEPRQIDSSGMSGTGWSSERATPSTPHSSIDYRDFQRLPLRPKLRTHEDAGSPDRLQPRPNSWQPSDVIGIVRDKGETRYRSSRTDEETQRKSNSPRSENGARSEPAARELDDGWETQSQSRTAQRRQPKNSRDLAFQGIHSSDDSDGPEVYSRRRRVQRRQNSTSKYPPTPGSSLTP